jgi:hypothetical protein
VSAAKYHRVLLKLSGEALLGDRAYGISPEYVRYLADEIRKVHALGVEVAIVVGGGNWLRGSAAAEHGLEEATAHYMGMLATIMNGLALQSQLEAVGIPTRVQSAISVTELAELVARAGREFGLEVMVKAIDDPRVEAQEHYYNATHTKLLDLGLEPHFLSETLIESMFEAIERYRGRVILDRILPRIRWQPREPLPASP